MLRSEKIFVCILLLITILSCKDDLVTPPIEEEKIQVKILSPKNNSKFAKSELIFFESLALSETGDTLMYDSLAWESNIDGRIGRYNTFQFLSPGNHKITCNVYKNDLSGSNDIFISISDDIIIDTMLINDKWEIYQLAEDYPTCIRTDKTGRVAVSYWQSGLYVNNKGKWEHFTKLDGLINSGLQAIGFDNNNEMYIGYYNVPGISKFNNPGWTELVMDDIYNDVHTIAFDKENTLWAAAHYGEILKYVNSNFISISNQPVLFGHPSELFFDEYNNLWGSSEHGGAFMFDGQDWTLFDIDGEFTKGNHIAIDKNNYKLVNNSNGLYYFNDTDTLHFNSENSPFRKNSITSMSSDKVSGIWIGTTEGLQKFDGINWEKYSMENSPILSNRVFNVYVDQNNNVWFSTEQQLVKFKNGN